MDQLVLCAYVLYFGAISAAAVIPDPTPVVVVVVLHFVLAGVVVKLKGPRHAFDDRYRSGCVRAAVAVSTDVMLLLALVTALLVDSNVLPCVLLALCGNIGCVALRTVLLPPTSTSTITSVLIQ